MTEDEFDPSDVEPIADYAIVLARLVELLGQPVAVGISGVRKAPPQFATAAGTLASDETPPQENRAEVEAIRADVNTIMEYHPEVLRLRVGNLALTLHPDHFAGGFWSKSNRHLNLKMGDVTIYVKQIEPEDERLDPGD
jgi:hypothetical protein